MIAAADSGSRETLYQVHFEPNGGTVYEGDKISPHYVAVSDSAQMAYVPGPTFTVLVPDAT